MNDGIGGGMGDDLPGQRVLRVGPVALAAITPEGRDLLDVIMEEWEPYEESWQRHAPPDTPMTPYGAFYWLVRHSGLIDPAAIMAAHDGLAARGLRVPPDGAAARCAVCGEVASVAFYEAEGRDLCWRHLPVGPLGREARARIDGARTLVAMAREQLGDDVEGRLARIIARSEQETLLGSMVEYRQRDAFAREDNVWLIAYAAWREADAAATRTELAERAVDWERRRERAREEWLFGDIADRERAVEEVRRLRAYIEEFASNRTDSDTDDPEVLKQRWLGRSRSLAGDAMVWYRQLEELGVLKHQIAVLLGMLVDLDPENGRKLARYGLDNDRLKRKVKGLKGELANQHRANRGHKDRYFALQTQYDALAAGDIGDAPPATGEAWGAGQREYFDAIAQAIRGAQPKHVHWLLIQLKAALAREAALREPAPVPVVAGPAAATAEERLARLIRAEGGGE